jgi:hypothetical protein
VSFVGQRDPRVKSIVAWDNLSAPAAAMSIPTCASAPATRTPPPITKPALGMAADYFLTPQPYTSNPDPNAKSQGSLAYTKAGVDTGELVIRGGTHYEFSYIPNPAFGASLRGMDLVAWYTAAWFDKYVKGDRSVDSRLVTDRWRSDGLEAAVDPDGDGNQFSFYYRSRLDIRVGGTRVRCEDLRSGCPALQRDCEPVPFSYLSLSLSPDKPYVDAPCRLNGSLSRGTKRCLPQRLRLTSRGIGPIRLGRSVGDLRRRYRHSGARYRVRGGGRVVVRGRRVTFVASTARGHRSPRLAPQRKARVKGRRIGRGVFRQGRLVYGVRRGKVRFVGASRLPRRALLRTVRRAF